MKNWNQLLLLTIGTFMFLNVSGQFENTLSFDEKEGSPRADLTVLDWLPGHWKGEAFGGIVEELWSPPLGGSMMCAFKLVVNDEVSFYEIVTLKEIEGTLILKLKHFDADLKGWEEKDETVDFKLVKASEGKVFFDGFTFEKVSENEINIYVIVGSGGQEQEVKFNYRRVEF